MSVSTEVQRTLVKSPPELWSELSDPEALARHLGELGEIRITSVEPESKVEWEADGVSGFVQLKQSGWGTKVTLSVMRTAPALEEPIAGDESAPAAEARSAPVTEVEAELVVTESDPVAPEPEPVVEEPELEPVAAQPLRREGFFARLFRRRKPEPVKVVEPEPEPDFEPLAAPDLLFEPTPKPVADLAAELASVEAQMVQETTELLTGVLDRLGAAHHRPFSRG